MSYWVHPASWRGKAPSISSQSSKSKSSSSAVSESASVWSSAPWVAIPHEILDSPYYHGRIPQGFARRLLSQPHDFLVRLSDNKGRPTIQVKTGRTPPEPPYRKIMIDWSPETDFTVACGKKFRSLDKLITHLMEDKSDVSFALGRPVERKRWELNLNDLINVEPISIGHGQYGQVHKGLLDVGKGMTVEVAVKMCRQDAEEENSADFFHEAEMTGSLWHPNVVRFIGIAVMGDPLMLVMEWCGGGSLESKLLKNAQLSDEDKGKLLNSEKIRLARMAAMGMEYIHRKGVIHRDLAARNCLLRDNGTLAVADFGLSEQAKEIRGTPKGVKLPIRHLAPESLVNDRYNQNTDVWSFGVLLWEIWSNGQKPYGDEKDIQVRVPRSELKLEIPDKAPVEIGSLMCRCLSFEFCERPAFKQIAIELKQLEENG